MLQTSLNVGPAADDVAFKLIVRNEGEEDVVLSFRDGQRTRFTVEPADGGDPVWRSDEGKMFMQMLGEETLPAGTSTTFGEVWESPEPGEYRVVGELTCEDHDLSADAEFTV